MIEPMHQSTYDYVWKGDTKVTVMVGDRTFHLLLNVGTPEEWLQESQILETKAMKIRDLKSLIIGHINGQTIASGPFLILGPHLP